MGLPIILLFVFLIRACTLEGASDGIKAYIGVWDVSVLRERGDVWSTAVAQASRSIVIALWHHPGQPDLTFFGSDILFHWCHLWYFDGSLLLRPTYRPGRL